VEAQLAQPQPQQPQQPGEGEEQKRFLQLINELLTTIHEVVYTANLIDDDIVKQHPELQDHVIAVKKLGKVSWEFFKYARGAARRQQQQ